MNLKSAPAYPTNVADFRFGSLAIKLALFAAMLSLAALNRWKLVPALSRASPASARHIRMSLAVEALLGFAVLIVVGWLGLLDPAG